MKTLFRLLTLVLTTTVFSSFANAQLRDEEINIKLIDSITAPLLELPYRPSVEEILNVVPRWVMTNPKARKALKARLSRATGGWEGVSNQVLDTDLANHIAKLELVMPHGTYAYLGRDSALPADLVEGFYRYLGEHDRGVRLNVSSSSFYGATPELINGFLQTNGLNFGDLKNSNGFLVLDVTSYNSSSQSARLVNNAIQRLRSLKYSPSVIAEKFSLGDLYGRGYQVSSLEDMDTVTSNRIQSIKNNKSFLKTIGTNAQSMTYSTAWHNTFQPFQKQGDDVVTLPGAIASIQDRKTTLAMLMLGLGHVMQDGFVSKVVSAAADYGYLFPEYSSLMEPDLKAAETRLKKKASAELRKAMSQTLLPASNTWRTFYKRRMTAEQKRLNAEYLKAWYSKYRRTPGAGLKLLKSAIKLRNEGKIVDAQLKTLSDLSGVTFGLNRQTCDALLEKKGT